MPNKLQKTLQDYLTKIKKPHHPQIQLTKILSGCKHPKTPSFALDGRNNKSSSHAVSNNTNTNNNKNHNDDAATLADVDRFLFENFKSLYFKDDDENENTTTTTTTTTTTNNNKLRVVSSEENHDEIPKLASFLFESPRFTKTPPPPPSPDLCGPTRFFVKPGNSGSLVEDSLSTLTNVTNTSDENEGEGGSGSNSSTSSTASPSNSKDQVVVVAAANEHTLPDNCIALLSYSPSPYEDFRRSMQDVVEARYGNINNINIDWDFMEEILFCYLKLNEKKSHKFILSAFVDLITVMRRNSDKTAPAKPCSVRTVRIGSREVRKKKTKQLTIEYGSS